MTSSPTAVISAWPGPGVPMVAPAPPAPPVAVLAPYGAAGDDEVGVTLATGAARRLSRSAAGPAVALALA